jgi:hypothetical protein
MMCFQDPPRVESVNHTWIPHVNNLRSKLIDGKLAGFFVRRSILQITKVFNTTDDYSLMKSAGLAD